MAPFTAGRSAWPFHRDKRKTGRQLLPSTGSVMCGLFDQTEKLVPQPQLATAFGLLIWKDWPSRLSTKSICEPAM